MHSDFNSRDELRSIFKHLNLDFGSLGGGDMPARSPIDGHELGGVRASNSAEVADAIGRAHEAYLAWRGWARFRR